MKWLCYLCLFLLTACQGGLPMKKSTTIFSVDAEEVRIFPIKSLLRQYKIVMNNVGSEVMLLDGRPISKVQVMTMQQFGARWDNPKYGFKKRPPHATMIVYATQSRGHLERTASLFKITDMSFDAVKNSLTIEVVAMSEVNPYIVGRPVKLSDFLIETND